MASQSILSKRPARAIRYEQDFYGWALEQAALLRQGRLSELDAANLAEELGDLGRAEFNSLVSALRVLTMHLLKWDHQPEKRSRSWELTIASQRLELADILKDSPGLKPRFDEALARAYRRARLEASSETGLDASVFPEACPYDLWAIATREIALR
jgi:predicted DNA-binding ribbon-helix-helix protein